MQNARLEQSNRSPLRHDLTVRMVRLDTLKSLGRETRRHSPRQVEKIAKSLATFGVVLPIVIDADGRVVAGGALVRAARRIDLPELPAIRALVIGRVDATQA